MAIFRFFNFHDQSVNNEKHEVFSPDELKQVIKKYFSDRIIRIRISYWGSDLEEKEDSYTVNVRFKNREAQSYNFSVGKIDEPFVEIEA